MQRIVILVCGMLVLSACGKMTFEPIPAVVPGESATPEPVVTQSSPPKDSIGEASETQVMPELPAEMPRHLAVVYVQNGDLWLWAGEQGARQITTGGGVSQVSISGDGHQVAFMRGNEIRLLQMDGSVEKLLATAQTDRGVALEFSPNNLLLAISTSVHIDVYDLSSSSINTVLTYPVIDDFDTGFLPQAAWLPDSSGFKTVIPDGRGTARLHYVFPNGTVADLATFNLLPLTESLPRISPDGGYIIYTAKVDEKSQSLFLMDSSGATRPYGQPDEKIRALRWRTDSVHFAYLSEGAQGARFFVGSIDGQPVEGASFGPADGQWLDAQHFLTLENGSLYLGDTRGGEVLIAGAVQQFDSVVLP